MLEYPLTVTALVSLATVLLFGLACAGPASAIVPRSVLAAIAATTLLPEKGTTMCHVLPLWISGSPHPRAPDCSSILLHRGGTAKHLFSRVT